MRYFVSAFAASALLLTVTTMAPAQSVRTYVSPGYQQVYPSNYYAQPQIGGSFSYQTPSFGLGINIGQPYYGPSYYPRPIYVPSYYPTPWYGHNHHHHHNHNHHNHGHHHHGHR